MLRLVMPQTLTVVVDVVAWGVFHAGTGYAAHRLGDDRLDREGWLLRPRAFEVGGRWYRRRLHINRWKDRVPEAGGLFAGGLSKRHLPAYDDAGLRAVRARDPARRARATGGRWAAAPLFVLWNPPLASALLITYGVGVNLPFIAIQRYNRFRTGAILERRARRCSGT